MPLSREQERELLRKWQEAQDLVAREKLIQANYGLAVKIACKFDPKRAIRQDLIQEGLLGLLISIDHFDLNREVRFTTYATFWVKQRIAEFVFRNRQVINSQGGYGRKIFWNRNRAEAQATKENNFNKARLAEIIGVPEKFIGSTIVEVPIVELEALQSNRMRSVTDRMALQTKDLNPEEQTANKETDQWVQAGLKRLDSREQDILKRRYLADKPQTLAAIGRRLGLSRERVRQLEARALKKLRPILQVA